MLNKYFMTVAIIAFGVVFSQDTFGQKEIVVWKSSASIKSPRDVATGQINGRNVSTTRGASQTAFTGSDEEIGAMIAWVRAPRPTSLIDTSTGEVVWADEVRSSGRKGQSAGRSSDLIDTNTGEITWDVVGKPRPKVRVNGRTRNLIDTSTGEIVW